MQGREFYDKVSQHPDFEWRGVQGEEVVVWSTRRKLFWLFPFSTIISNPWEEIEAVMTGQRDASIMRHIARIVGYYSRVENWSGSKRAELADRQRGNYAVSEKALRRQA